MHKYEVGKLYSTKRTRWPQGSDYNFRLDGHELRLFLPDAEPLEIEDVRAGRAQFRLFTQQGLLVLLYKFGSMPWSDASYNWHLVLPDDERSIPVDPEDASIGAALTVIFIESNTGLIKALRLIGLGHEFTKTLHAEIRKQIESPFDEADYMSRLNSVYSMYTSDQMAQVAKIKYTVGE